MERQAIIENCQGCSRIEDGYCRAYINPAYKWEQGWCNHCDIPQEKMTEEQKRLNPLKASRRSMAGGLHLRKYAHNRNKNKGTSKKRYLDYLDVRSEQKANRQGRKGK